MSRKVSTEQLKQVRDWRMSGLAWEQCRLRLGDAGVIIQTKNLIILCRNNSTKRVVRGQVRYEPWCAPEVRRVQGQAKAKLAVLSEKPSVAKKSYIVSVPANRTDLSVSAKPSQTEKVTSKQVVPAGSSADPGRLSVISDSVEPSSPVIPGDLLIPGHEATSRVDKLEKQSGADQVQEEGQVTQVQPAFEANSGVVARESAEATKPSGVISSTPGQVPTEPAQPSTSIPASASAPKPLTKEERDAKRRTLIAGASVAQAKLDAEKAAQERIAQEMADNEKEMDKIGKDIALEGVNRVALDTKPL